MTPEEQGAARRYRQQARLAWARLRVAALDLRQARRLLAEVDPTAPERIVHVHTRDLEIAEGEWREAWWLLSEARQWREAMGTVKS